MNDKANASATEPHVKFYLLSYKREMVGFYAHHRHQILFLRCYTLSRISPQRTTKSSPWRLTKISNHSRC